MRRIPGFVGEALASDPSVLTAWPHVPATAMPESADRSSCMTSAHWFPILVELVWNGGDMWRFLAF